MGYHFVTRYTTRLSDGENCGGYDKNTALRLVYNIQNPTCELAEDGGGRPQAHHKKQTRTAPATMSDDKPTAAELQAAREAYDVYLKVGRRPPARR